MSRALSNDWDQQMEEDLKCKLLHNVETALVQCFTDLSERHIFQWSTDYRDSLQPIFHTILELRSKGIDASRLADILRRSYQTHSEEVFSKGYKFVTKANSTDAHQQTHRIAIEKGLTGLQRFLELPLDFYSSYLFSRQINDSVLLRKTSSAALAGVLCGFSAVQFGNQTGASLLPRLPRKWAHYVGFLTESDCRAVIAGLEAGPLTEGLSNSVLPVLSALDALSVEFREEGTALPALSQFDMEEHRLDISLRRSTFGDTGRPVSISCFLEGSFVSAPRLDEGANRGLAIIVAPLRADVEAYCLSKDNLRRVVVNVSQLGTTPGVAVTKVRVQQILDLEISRSATPANAATPLTYNFARDFPLDNPHLSRYFHVQRPSVRRLLADFERRNGVRLWCSVRRSGKTTASQDMGSTTGGASVVTQTCGTTPLNDQGDLFYRRVANALQERRTIPKDFLLRAVKDADSMSGQMGERFVFVLDEYETLFEHMASVARNDKEARYTVIQPLMGQMVEFASSNLLVLLGQRPDAHFILMDQNQLSAYVKQEAFPLFAHGASDPEFRDFVQKVLTDRIGFDETFISAVHKETGGHPFLTVKILVHLLDVLIAERRPIRGLSLSEEDFLACMRMVSEPSFIGSSTEFAFFRRAASESLGEAARTTIPWLYGVYWILRRLVQNSPTTMSVSQSDYYGIVAQLGLAEGLGVNPDELLGGGILANFFICNSDTVQPCIPLLARIAARATPQFC